MGFRTDIRLQGTQSAFTTTASTSVGLTITGSSGKSIYLTKLTTSMTGASVGATLQLARVFDGATEVFRTAGLTGVDVTFYSPLRISSGSNCVATQSVTAATTKTGAVFATYYIE